MFVRRAKAGDVAEVVEMSAALFREDAGNRDASMNLSWPDEEGREYFSAFVADEECVCFVAEKGGEIVGYLAGRMRRGASIRPVDVADLESMYVREEHRRSGIGASLVEEFFRWAAKKEARKASVTAYASNERAKNFYERMGFHPRQISLETDL